ncbi:MAG: quinolinate synthase NadA [Nitrososphaeria archaeon]
MENNLLSLQNRIKDLKIKRNAIILAHNYQPAEVQDIADFVGDSLELSQKAAMSDATTIVFCGVHFMAETAVILCPEKKVLMPEVNAGCPMANMITVEGLKSLKRAYPNAKVVCYVNTKAEVKAESDICCSSSNAVKVVESIRDHEIIFIPDKYLAHYVYTKTGKKIISWHGYCPTHAKILPEHIMRQKKIHPQAEVIVHPECAPTTIALADRVLSTGGMCKYARESKVREMIIGTETSILHRLRKENPEKEFYPASELAICPNMKMTTIEKVLWSLQDMSTEIKIPYDIRFRAKAAVDKMLEIS